VRYYNPFPVPFFDIGYGEYPTGIVASPYGGLLYIFVDAWFDHNGN